MKMGGFLIVAFLTTALAAQAPPDRSRPPALAPVPELKLPPIQKRALSNGLPVWVVETHDVPLVQVNLVVMAGAADDPAGKFGTSSLTAAMLDEGAGVRSALEIADAVEFLGASLNTSSSFDFSAVRLNVPLPRLQDGLGIMADVALRPTLPTQDLERLRQERLTALLQARDDPPTITAMAFSRILYGTTHRYGTGQAGNETMLKALVASDLRAFHNTFYQPTNATLVVVGDVTAEAIMPLLEKQFGGWRGAGAVRRAPIADAAQLTRGQIHVVDKPDSEQSQIRIGWIGVSRTTPDYFALQVMNTILGGSFTSRLNQNLRERNGYSYGASSFFDMRLGAGPFIAAAGVQTDKTSEALREFFNELNAIRRPVPADEVTKAKNYIALGFPSGFESSSDIAGALEDLIVYRLPDDHYERYVANVQAVTPEAVLKAAMRYLDPGRFAVVVVGDRRTIEAGVRGLNTLPVRVMTVEEAIGS